MKREMALVFLLLLFTVFIQAEEKSLLNKESAPIEVNLEYEMGVTTVLYHTIKFGSNGTVFDYRINGGQEILFPFDRFQVGALLSKQHRLKFLYQPIEINTKAVFKDNVTIDNVIFPIGTTVDMKYGFPFYRLTYNYDFFKSKKLDLGAGAALQLRNASITFASADGTITTVNQNLGPVPALNFYYRQVFESDLSLAADITGLYASSAFINGASFAFEGSILDASVRVGCALKNKAELFFNVRFLGGSAAGTSSYPKVYWTQGTENYTANYLATLTASLGMTLY